MTQDYENHVRIVPGYHYVAFGIFAINLLWSLYRVIRFFGAESVVSLLLAVGFLLLFFYARIFALTVQDRVIRLEMAMRFAQCLPPDLMSRGELDIGQVVALRFAGDEELPELVRKVLAEKLTDRKTIKKLIKHWRPDLLRV